MKLLLTMLLILSTAACSQGSLDSVQSQKNLFWTRTAKITNLAGTSGGSGTVIYSDDIHSEILTNGHVCEVAVNGGKVSTQDGKYSGVVASFKKSMLHDLCLITVMADLHAFTPLAANPPGMLEPATISGHPHLLPITITTGVFSSKQVIQVQTGFEPCTAADQENPTTALICLFVGGIPVVKTYEAEHVTATIQPGSSGSGIYNAAGELSAVVFAGGGDIGYTFAVPYEYVSAFLLREIKLLPSFKPNMFINFRADASRHSLTETDFISACKNNPKLKDDKTCKTFIEGAIFFR